MSELKRSIDLTLVSEWQDGKLRRVEDYLVAEEPLEIRVNGQPLNVTMRTPGHDVELAAGFLFTEGLIKDGNQIRKIKHGGTPAEQQRGNVIAVELCGAEYDPKRLQRNFFAASSCGICGKDSIDAIRVRGAKPPNENFRFNADLLCELPEKLKSSQAIFDRTGGLHAAAAFSENGELVILREDIGRHNAVDKVVGYGLLNGLLPFSDQVLLVSGRGGFEIIQKALVAGFPLLASVSAPSSLAVQLARELGLTLVGFLRGRRFIVYSGEGRLKMDHHS